MRFGIKAWILVSTMVGAMSGCAAPGGHPQDPIEPFNRAMFSFNETVDEAVLQPVARGYRTALPELIRTGVSNFFSNLEDLWIAANNLLQGKPVEGVQDAARFVFNSTFGLLGVIDVSTDFNLPKHNEDFGQTLGRWGAGTGPYLVLPIFGSSNIRDAVGFVVDFKADIVKNINHIPSRNTLFAIRTINTRSNLLDIGRVAEEAALDKYRFIRDAHFQRRRNLVYDGEPPREPGRSALPLSIEQSVSAEALGAVGLESAESADAPRIAAVRTGDDRDAVPPAVSN